VTVRSVPRVGLIGTVLEAQPTLRALLASNLVDVAVLVTTPDPPVRVQAGAGNLIGPASMAGVPVVLTNDVNDSHVVAAIGALSVDLLVAVGWNRLLGPELLAVPGRGCVGFHASLLPRNRGHAPVNWAILRGETTTGNTMMMLDAGVDTGDVIEQSVIEIGPDDTCGTVYRQVARTGAHMLISHLPRLLDGTVERQPQRSAIGGEALPRRTPDMGVIDWDQPPRVLHDWVRALTIPYPGAFTRLNGHPIMIWATRCPEPVERLGSPRELLCYERDGVRVGARGGSVVVTRMSEPGRRPARASQWCRRAELVPGARFDAIPAELRRWARGVSTHPAMSA
jgi:methionyl-tRNA formyltransferase